jgi:hypothetical protein
MLERVYDTLKAILWTDFPKNNQGVPYIYDRTIDEWFFGDRQILPAPLGVVLRASQGELKDIGFGLREIDYTINITFYSSGDNAETSERVVQESARLAHSILKNHRTMWICELCPFTESLPLSPIHYIDNGVITNVTVNACNAPTTITVNPGGQGYTAPAYISISTSVTGALTVSQILSSGLGITTTSYADSNCNLSFQLSGGTSLTGYATNIMTTYLTKVINQVNSYWQETHLSSSPPFYDWAGVAYQTIQEFVTDWGAGIQPVQILSNTNWKNNLNSIIQNNTDIVRLIQDIQVGSIKPSDDGMEKAFMHSAEFTLKAKEIISVDQFGPNNVNVNAV